MNNDLNRVSFVNNFLDREFYNKNSKFHDTKSSLYTPSPSQDKPGELFRRIHTCIGKNFFISINTNNTVELKKIKWWQRFGVIRRLFYKYQFFFNKEEKKLIDKHFIDLCNSRKLQADTRGNAANERNVLLGSLSPDESSQYNKLPFADQKACLAFLKAKKDPSFSLEAWAKAHGIPLSSEELMFCNKLSPLQQFHYCQFFPDERSDYALLDPSKRILIDEQWYSMNKEVSTTHLVNDPQNWEQTLCNKIWKDVVCKEIHAMHDAQYPKDSDEHIRIRSILRIAVDKLPPFEKTILEKLGKHPSEYGAQWRQHFASELGRKKERSDYWSQLSEPERSLLPTLSRKEYLCYLHEMSADQQQAFLDFLSAIHTNTFDTWLAQQDLSLTTEEGDFCNTLPPLQRFRYCKVTPSERSDYALLCPSSRYQVGDLSSVEEKEKLEELLLNPAHWNDQIFNHLYNEVIRKELIAAKRSEASDLFDKYFLEKYPLSLTTQEERRLFLDLWGDNANIDVEYVAPKWRAQCAPPIAKRK